MRAGELSVAAEEVYRSDGWVIVGRSIWDAHGQGLRKHLPPHAWPGSQEVLRNNMILNQHPGVVTEDRLGLFAHQQLRGHAGWRPRAGRLSSRVASAGAVASPHHAGSEPLEYAAAHPWSGMGRLFGNALCQIGLSAPGSADRAPRATHPPSG